MSNTGETHNDCDFRNPPKRKILLDTSESDSDLNAKKISMEKNNNKGYKTKTELKNEIELLKTEITNLKELIINLTNKDNQNDKESTFEENQLKETDYTVVKNRRTKSYIDGDSLLINHNYNMDTVSDDNNLLSPITKKNKNNEYVFNKKLNNSFNKKNDNSMKINSSNLNNDSVMTEINVIEKGDLITTNNNKDFIDVLKTKNAKKKEAFSIQSMDNNKTIVNNIHDSINKYNNNKLNNNNNPVDINKISANKKIPPINVFEQDPKDIIQLLTENVKLMKNEFYLKHINKKKIAIYVNNLDNFNKCKNVLDLIEANYYSYTPVEEKNKTFVLKGLHVKENVENILNYLVESNEKTIEFIKVVRLTTPKSVKENKILPIYLVQIGPNSNVADLYKIKYLNNQVIQWEKIKRDEIIQCKRCQRFGHAAPNCKLDYRCVKCNENHGPGECNITNGEVDHEQIYCILCQSNGHPASYRGCPEYIKLKLGMKNNKKIIKEKLQTNSKYINNYTNPNKSFAQLFTQKNENLGSIEQKSPLNDIKNSLEMICNKLTFLSKTTTDNSQRIDILFNILHNGNN